MRKAGRGDILYTGCREGVTEKIPDKRVFSKFTFTASNFSFTGSIFSFTASLLHFSFFFQLQDLDRSPMYIKKTTLLATMRNRL